MSDISQTRLSALQKRFQSDRATDDQINPRFVKSIQQSLAAEGYRVSEQAVRDARFFE